ncbi:toprim domain-containing protein [uncultured Methanomethylovorans sp.]|uniref:toprim domain-containing protein n=1 Tax=uncultured Methanomethylovorans sp. TaxID=183759 RepID=UPI002AA837F1|nr:toprim domain-containing protein [uncultured Methanomethylovorans sp.]
MSKNVKSYRISGYEKKLKAPMFVYRKRLELIEKIVEELLCFSREGNIILVEGKRDKLSLGKLGIEGKIEVVTHHPLTDVCEKVAAAGKKVVILTDWDRRGMMLEKKIAEHLEQYGIRIEHQLRKRILYLVQKDIKDVESLYTHITKLRQIADPEYDYNNTDDDVFI